VVDLVLTDDEVAMLTEYTRKAEQCRELSRLGIPFKCSRTGRPLVPRDAASKALGANSGRTKPYAAPDLDALKAVS